MSGNAKMPPASHQVSATSFKLLIQQIHPHVRVDRDSGMCVARDRYELWGRSPYTRILSLNLIFACRLGPDLDMACRPTQNRKIPEEECKCGAASQTRLRRGAAKPDGGDSRNDVRPVKKAKADSKKPLAAAKPKGAPKAARYQWIFHEAHSQRRLQANGHRKIQIKRI